MYYFAWNIKYKCTNNIDKYNELFKSCIAPYISIHLNLTKWTEFPVLNKYKRVTLLINELTFHNSKHCFIGDPDRYMNCISVMFLVKVKKTVQKHFNLNRKNIEENHTFVGNIIWYGRLLNFII